MVRIGSFNLKDDSIDHIVETFYAFLDNVLQSYSSLDLTKPGKLFIKVLGPEHMRSIRIRQRRLNDDLEIINRGLPSDDKKFQLPEMYQANFFINIPRDYINKDGQKCFENYCLTLSIIAGRIQQYQ